MPEPVFRFKQFTVEQDKCAMKVGTDGVLLGAWAEVPENGNILDIGAGTGLLALMLAQRTDCQIDAIEIDENASIQAGTNFAASVWSNRLNIHQIALQQFHTDYLYDLIICNPPYFVNAKGIAEHQRRLARNSTHLTMNELMQKSSLLLQPTGSLALIIPAEQLGPTEAVAAENGFFPYRLLQVKGTTGTPIKRILVQFRKKESTCQIEELIIESGRGIYTSEYRKLTGEFYLAF